MSDKSAGLPAIIASMIAQAIKGLRFLRPALALILVLAAAKMLLSEVFEVPAGISLGLIAAILVLSIVASRLFPRAAGAAGATR